ncbi:helix-turn-helix domain-containing protein [Nocardioides sp.]|uniref:TetR/AcrR family transcriptional regulator n=1 Tax=Nocardioides sp. TaxID=35761 RepID=UPI002ED82F91
MPAAKFTRDGILDAAAEEVLTRGSGADVTIGAVARRLGAPSGSIYHRFPSREELLVRLWIRSVRRFHERYLAAGREADPQRAILDMAVCVATFTRDHRADAAAMTLFRQSRLMASAPESCRAEVVEINAGVNERLAELTVARYSRPSPRHRVLVRVAAIDSPYGLVRPYVGDAVPSWLAEVIRASSGAVLELGDRRRRPRDGELAGFSA